MTGDSVAHVEGEVEPASIPLEHLDHSQGLLVVLETAPVTLAKAVVEHRLADVTEGRVPEVVPETDRLGKVLVKPQRTGNRARDLCDLDRVG